GLDERPLPRRPAGAAHPEDVRSQRRAGRDDPDREPPAGLEHDGRAAHGVPDDARPRVGRDRRHRARRDRDQRPAHGRRARVRARARGAAAHARVLPAAAAPVRRVPRRAFGGGRHRTRLRRPRRAGEDPRPGARRRSPAARADGRPVRRRRRDLRRRFADGPRRVLARDPARPNGCGRRPDRRRQDHGRERPPAIRRPRSGVGHRRRRAAVRARPGALAHPGGVGAAAGIAVPRQRGREPAPRAARRLTRRTRGGGERRQRPPIRREPARGVRDAHRRGRRPAERRGAPAPRAGAGLPQGRAAPDPGRADVASRSRERVARARTPPRAGGGRGPRRLTARGTCGRGPPLRAVRCTGRPGHTDRVRGTAVTPGPLRRLVRLAAPVRGWLLLVGLASFGALAANIALMTAAPYLISRAALVNGFAALTVAVTAVRGFAIARAALRYSERYVAHLAALRVLTEIRVWLYRAIEPLAPGGLRGFRSGDLLARTVADVDTLDAFFVRLVPPAAAVLAVAFACAILAVFEPAMAIVLFAFLAIGGVAVPLVARRLARHPSMRSIAARADLHSALASDLSGLADLTGFGQEGRLGGDLAASSRAMDRERRTLSSIRGAAGGAGSILAGVAGLAVLALAIPEVRGGGIEGVFLASLPLVAFAAYEAVL